MASYITDKRNVKAMVAALEKLPKVQVVWSDTGVYVKHPKGMEVFRAMVGSSGKYLVRHPDELFI